MWICSMNRDKTDCGREKNQKDKITEGPANKPSDIRA